MASESSPPPELLICSAGGVGTTMLIRHFRDAGVATNHPMDSDDLKHSVSPPAIPTVTRAIYVFGDPQDAYRSLVRRGFLERQIQKIGARGTPEDPLALRHHYESWMSEESDYPIMFIRYDDLWVKQQDMIDFVGAGVGAVTIPPLPSRTPRHTSSNEPLPTIEGRTLYEDYAALVARLPPLWVRRADRTGAAAIVCLARGHRSWPSYEKNLHTRNLKAHKHFNVYFDYPMFIFNEGTITEEHKQRMRTETPNIHFVDISKWWQDNDDLGGGYKKMCYFYTHFLPNWLHEHNFDFYLRLDDDVFLEDSPNPLDVVAWMQEQSLDYVYGRRKIDSHGETQRSLTAFCADWFAKRNMVAPENIAYNYYNNFSVGRVAFWFRPSVQEFLRDTREGIKRFRWGDSTLQAVALRAFGGERSVIPVIYTHGSHGYRSFSRSGDYLPQHQWDE